jgi:hypothetical protein
LIILSLLVEVVVVLEIQVLHLLVEVEQVVIYQALVILLVQIP